MPSRYSRPGSGLVACSCWRKVLARSRSEQPLAAGDPAGGVQAGQVRPGGREQDRERGQRRGGGDGLGAELEPG